MKKLFSILFALMFVATLSACGSEGQGEIEDGSLENRIDSLEDTVSEQRDRIHDMESLVAALETQVNEKKIVFTVDTGETTLARTVPYFESSEQNAFELLNLAYDIEYEESDFGIFIEGIESLQAQEGSFIAISKNGTMIETGLSEASFEGGDHFHFELQWWDETLKDVHHSIDLFVENQADDFLESQNFHVVLGLHHLGYEAKLQDLEKPEPDEEAEVGTLIQAIFTREVMEEDASDLRARLAEDATTDYAYTAAQTYLALNTGDIDDHNGFVDDFTTLLDDFEVSEEKDKHDTYSMVLLALSVMEETEYDTLFNDLVSYLEDHAYEYEHGDNPATFASMITALTVAGEDVTAETYVKDGQNLLEHLLAYQTDEGAFLYSLDDEEPDFRFSTPQAFLALASYQASLNNETFTHPYSVDRP